ETTETRLLKLMLLRAYNVKLKERMRVRGFVIDHGLTDLRRVQEERFITENTKVDAAHPRVKELSELSESGKEDLAKLRPIAPFFSKKDYDTLIDSFREERILRKKIDELVEVQRKYGVKYLCTIDKVKKTVARREEEGRKRRSLVGMNRLTEEEVSLLSGELGIPLNSPKEDLK
ncbi:hypothetical protein ADUPG1_007374, partial [Aduncisulcus paluster]